MTDAQALNEIREAAAKGRYAIHLHCRKRMTKRGFDLFDVKAALMTATQVEPYADPGHLPMPHGTSWRVSGFDTEGDALSLGVDLLRDHLGHFVLVVTAF
jgi:hypothetical protein